MYDPRAVSSRVHECGILLWHTRGLCTDHLSADVFSEESL